MGRPYNKQTVEDAALLCETLASNPHLGDMQWTALFLGIRESSTAFALAGAAFDVVDDTLYRKFNEVWADEAYEKCWAEAAALIADGWQIGDEVVLLDHANVIADENVPQDRVYLLNKNADGSLTPAGATVFHIVDDLASVVFPPDGFPQDNRKMQDDVISLEDAPMSGEMKFKACAMLQAMTATPIETETPVVGGANVMDENGLEPPEPSYNPGDNFFVPEDDGV